MVIWSCVNQKKQRNCYRQIKLELQLKISINLLKI